MIKVGALRFLVLFLFITQLSIAQKKVKYKDVYSLLSTKQYDAAEPFLKRYLTEESDNPSALLYMAIIYQEKYVRHDILKETNKAVSDIDSAIFFFNKALSTMTERELKKNEEYYQDYKRRDLRTGEFGVKLADIQFDVEKRVENLNDQRKRLLLTWQFFNKAGEFYALANKKFNSLQQSYATENVLFLRADEACITNLKELQLLFDSCLSYYNNYQTGLKKLNTDQYRQKIELKPIKNFNEDGKSIDDPYNAIILLWDYKTFSIDHLAIIDNEVMPMRASLIDIDNELNELRDKFNSDSISVTVALTEVQKTIDALPIRKYDKTPLPLDIFYMKMKDLEYKSARVENKQAKDSSNVHYKLSQVQQEAKTMKQLDSVVSNLLQVDLKEEVLNYQSYITPVYQNDVILSSYFKAVKEYAEKELNKLAAGLAACEEAKYWLRVDSVQVPLDTVRKSEVFLPLLIEDEKYTAGIATQNSEREVYFYTITPSRVPDLKVTFPIKDPAFLSDKDKPLKALAITMNDLIYFVMIYHADGPSEKVPVLLAKIYHSDGLSWKNSYTLDFIPTSMEYKNDKGLLSITNGEKSVVLDKNGKMLK